jgi:hypothetical protein
LLLDAVNVCQSVPRHVHNFWIARQGRRHRQPLLLPSTSPKTLAFNLGKKFRHLLHPHAPILVRCAFSRLDYGSLSLRPVVLLALLSKLTRLASRQARILTTNEVGQYVASDLPGGHYTVRAEAQGFKATLVADITMKSSR